VTNRSTVVERPQCLQKKGGRGKSGRAIVGPATSLLAEAAVLVLALGL
jgi:hypothetical protein